MLSLLGHVARLRLMRYTLVSAMALAADTGSFLALLALGTAPTPASAVGYTLGIGVHWLISSRFVFSETLAAPGLERLRQKVLFTAAALAGLVLTTLIVGVATYLGVDPRLAKVVAVGASFMTTWSLRHWFVFDTARG